MRQAAPGFEMLRHSALFPVRKRLRALRRKAMAWIRRTDAANRLTIVLVVAAALAGIATYAVISGSPPYGSDVRTVVVLLNLDLILLLLLGAIVARRLVQLFVARRRGSAGSKLHVRLVALFSVVAAAPAIIVVVFSVFFLNYGVDTWFSERVKSAIDSSMSVARAYLEEHKEVIRADALAMAADLNREGPQLAGNRAGFQRLVDNQAALRALTEAIVFQGSGQVLARTGLSFALEIERIPFDVLSRAASGGVVVLTSGTSDRVRALVRLDAFVDAYLYVGRFVDPTVLSFMDRTQQAVEQYQQMESERSGIQITFALIFGLVALLLLLVAVWVGMWMADQLATPVSRLIAAAERVRVGDLTARVPERPEADEIGSLIRAFNRMTNQLSSQRQELIAANRQLDQRRRFTEAVLTGVTAGVIGLDGAGRITLANASAATLLGEESEALVGQPLIALVPEVNALLTRLGTQPDHPAQRQLEVTRGGRTRTLLARISAQIGDADVVGYVLTFDDITDLLAAQREAAWSDVARRIAHEIKNPLTPIQLSAERIKRKYLKEIQSDKETFEGVVDTIVRQVDTIRRLINEFSDFARTPAPVFRLESGADLIRHAVTLQRGAWTSIEFETQLPEQDLRLYCDAHKVAQALTNLLQNAVDSIRAKGGGDGGPAGTIRVSLARKGGTSVIEVTDDGEGLPDGPPARLMQPYFTTREGGTGLGLAIVRKIMEEHGGEFEIKGVRSGGARARLVFPDAPAGVASAA